MENTIKKWEDITEQDFQGLRTKKSSFKMVKGRFVLIVKGSIKDAQDASTEVSIEFQTKVEGEHFDRVFICALIPEERLLLKEETEEYQKDTFASNKFIILSEYQLETIVDMHNSWIVEIQSLLKKQELERDNLLLNHKII